MTAEGIRVGVEAAGEFRLNRQALADFLGTPDGPVAAELQRRANSVERRAKRLCPVDTGRLRASITNALEKDPEGVSAVIGTNVEYAVYVEFGTGDTRPQPFLRPALVERGLS
ncbi:MAG TPA: HK97-gp10 family putative phage morphogenesis protein [Acidimicrobiales bacterium]